MPTDYEIENQRAIAGGGRAGWEARQRIKRHKACARNITLSEDQIEVLKHGTAAEAQGIILEILDQAKNQGERQE